MADAAQVDGIITVLAQQIKWEDKHLASGALKEAVTALIKDQGDLGAQETVKAALNALGQGKTVAAKALFAKQAGNPHTDSQQAAVMWRNLAALMALNSAQEAIAGYRKAARLEPSNANTWDHLGHLLNNTESSQEAIDMFNKQLALAENNADPKAQALAYGNLAEAYQTQREFAKAVAFLQEALQINEALSDKAGVAKIYNDLGIAYFNSRDHSEQAIASFQKALQIYSAMGESGEVAHQYNNLGDAYQKRGDLPQTIAFYQKSLQAYEKLADKSKIALNYRNLGIIYKINQDLDKALPMLQNALQLDQALGDNNGIAFDCNYLGLVYQLKGDKAEARRYYSRSIELYRMLDSEDAEPVQDLLDQL